MSTLFWGLAVMICLTVFGYGVVIILLSLFLPRRQAPSPPPLRATLLIAAHNEENCIGAKLRNALAQAMDRHALSVVVVSDGSTDRTADIVRGCGAPNVSVLDIRDHVGKIAAMKQALETVDDDIVIFSDANSEFAPGALRALLEPFGDPEVGGVCGALVIAQRRGAWLGVAERVYWLYDNMLKRAEGRLGGAVSAQGSLYAVRRGLIGDVPVSVADDFYISTQVVAAGKRLAYAPAAETREAVSTNTRGEFGRRVRSTERGWRGLLARRGLLNPLRTGAYAVQLLFHKVLRRMVPFMLVGLLVVSAFLAPGDPFYLTAFLVQVAFYSLALGALIWPPVRRVPGATLAFFFVETQIAMALGLLRVALGKHSRSWKPVRDTQSVA